VSQHHTMVQRGTSAGARQFEPEITPAGQVDWRSVRTTSGPASNPYGGCGTCITIGIILLTPIIAFLSALILVALLGIFIAWLSVVGVLFAATVAPDLMRYTWRCAYFPVGALAHRAVGYPGR
jgi:hypothetical protein